MTPTQLNAPLTGTAEEQAVELYNLRRELAAAKLALQLQDGVIGFDEVEALVPLVTNKHPHTDGYLLTTNDLVLLLGHVRFQG